MQTEVMEMKFNEKLQKLRKEKGMSQEALADELGVSRQAVSKWENGQVYPETEKLIQLGRLFHVSIDYLLNEENEQGVQDTADQDEGTLSVSMGVCQEKCVSFFVSFFTSVNLFCYLQIYHHHF